MTTKKKGVFWVNIYRKGLSKVFLGREDADYCSDNTRIACVRVEWTEGEGL